MCVDEKTAEWARRPVRHAQPGTMFTPLVVGPDQIPRVSDPEAAREAPELAVLSALAHGREPGNDDVLDGLAAALDGVETERALMYLRLVLAALPQAARTHLEDLMATGTFEYQSEFTERLRTEGRSEAVAHSVLRVLQVRRLSVPDAVRTRVLSSRDDEELDRWLARAVVVAAAEDLFDGPATG